MLILSTLFGLGHLLIGSLYVAVNNDPVALWSKELPIHLALFWVSLPIVPNFGLFFDSFESGHWITAHPALFVAGWVVAAIMVLVTWLLVRSMIRRFPKVTGRTETVCAPERPMPPGTGR
jgi:hypothetical protein